MIVVDQHHALNGERLVPLDFKPALLPLAVDLMIAHLCPRKPSLRTNDMLRNRAGNLADFLGQPVQHFCQSDDEHLLVNYAGDSIHDARGRSPSVPVAGDAAISSV